MSHHVFAEEGGKLRFRGDFDALYAVEPDPWFQSGDGEMGEYYEHSRRTLANALLLCSSGMGLEIGCGHGHLTALLRERLRTRVIGMDVSAAAIERAKELHSLADFVTGDITAKDFDPPFRVNFAVWGQILWYVLHAIERTVNNTVRCIEPGGILAVSQAFLRGEQRYGADIANGFHGALALFLDRFSDRLMLIEAKHDDTDRFVHRDGLMIFRVM